MNSKNDTPGINETSFNLIFDQKTFNKSDILANDPIELIVIGEAVCKNVKWYHKLLNFISFRYLCVLYYVYKVKKL